MKYRDVVGVLIWFVMILIIVLSLVFIIEMVTKEPIVELKSGIVTWHTYRDGPVMVVCLENGETVELVNWTEPVGEHVEVPVVVGFKSLLGILWKGE